MGMCSEMLTVIQQTTAMAAFATPELRHMFGEWLKGLEVKAEAAVAEGEKDATALATALEIDEHSARYVLGRLAAEGKVTLLARRRSRTVASVSGSGASCPQSAATGRARGRLPAHRGFDTSQGGNFRPSTMLA
jgi:hypothetical protein